MFINNHSKKQYDTVIVGAGPAGITLALALAKKTNQTILIVESGSLTWDKKINSLSQVKATGDLHSHYYPGHAQRIFGGTSSVWMGFCAQLEERSFKNNEWPISFSDIKPYYQPAAKILDLPENAFALSHQEIPNADNITYRPYYLSRPPTRFGEKYAEELQQHKTIDILTEHTCTGIVRSNTQISHITVQNSLGGMPSMNIQGKNFILACGGTGNPKLLLQNNIGDESPVGNYFMEHPHIYNAGSMEIDESFLEPLFSSDNVSHAIQLSDDYCLKHNLLNMTADIKIRPREPRLFLGKKKMAYISSVTLRAEMQPQKENRLSLGDKTDYLGQAVPNINFNFNYQDMLEKSWAALSQEMIKSGLGRASSVIDPKSKITGGGHYIGTTRMGAESKKSVVDKNSKVHGLDNLYVTGSSIFPASAAANPTYSIVAFALRLADHISQH